MGKHGTMTIRHLESATIVHCPGVVTLAARASAGGHGSTFLYHAKAGSSTEIFTTVIGAFDYGVAAGTSSATTPCLAVATHGDFAIPYSIASTAMVHHAAVSHACSTAGEVFMSTERLELHPVGVTPS
ncbi:hypothetical protein ACH5RR_012454 [Cinchona calisaya]|uniref:Uncharacterized protein n=1 Tax=Cinchona calisaya TaxID=153742 RepID=A0ABD3A9D7_9GENT